MLVTISVFCRLVCMQLYQESVLNDPKTRFLQEFIIKDHLNVPNK